MDTITVPIIRNDRDFDEVADRIAALMNSPEGSKEADELEALMALAEAYERTHHAPMEPLSPQELVRTLMSERDMSQRDLVPVFGNSARVSDFFHGKRQLSKAQMQGLHKTLGIPYELLFA